MKTKYRKGKLINSVEDLLKRLDAGQWVFMYGRPKHPSFLVNLPLKKLKALVLVGTFFEAIEKNGTNPTGTMHHSPSSHTPHWLIDSDNLARCQFPGCHEIKQYQSNAELEDKLSKQRNYKVKDD